MKRPLWMVLVCAVVLQAISAAPAHAWWEYIEALSGPNLHGPHFEARMLCFMEERTVDDLRILSGFAPRDPKGGRTLVFGATLPCLHKVNLPDKANPADYRRAFSIDLGARWHWDDNFGPANGNKVNFFTITPVVTWYPIRRPTRDVIDLSAGIGKYWFVSNAFPSFSGRFYDARVDLHVPTVVRRLGRWTFLIPTWRFGVLDFPEGFDANVFADVNNGFTSKPMPGAERVGYVGFFFDLDALYK